MIFIGICGASGSGKSTLAEEIENRLGPQNCLVLQQDAYYRDHPDLTFEQRVHLNYDEPQIFDHDALLQDICLLEQGRPITRKAYDYAAHRRADDEAQLIQPRQVVVLEGIHCFFDERLRSRMFMKLYMKVDPDVCLLRRISRDIKERGRDIDGIAEQYSNTVKPMYEQYIRHYDRFADMIVAGGGKNAKVVDMLAGYLQNRLKEQP